MYLSLSIDVMTINCNRELLKQFVRLLSIQLIMPETAHAVITRLPLKSNEICRHQTLLC